MQVLESRILKLKADIKSYQERLSDYSYKPNYTPQGYAKRAETLRRKEEKLQSLQDNKG